MIGAPTTTGTIMRVAFEGQLNRRGRSGASTPIVSGLCTPQSDDTGKGVVS